MSDKDINLESTLQQLTFAKPSENYLSIGTSIISQNSPRYSFWDPRTALAISAALLLSLGFNTFQWNATNKGTSEGSRLSASNELLISDVSETNSVFRFLCLTRTTVTINNSLNLGELKGFGEWAFFEIPNNYQVTVSLLPLRDWNTIGQFEDGVISLQLEQGEQMELHGVGLGPSSTKRGGPFPVYGNIHSFGADNGIKSLANEDGSNREPEDETTIQENSTEHSQITNILAGVDSALSPLTQKYFGALLSSDECG